MFKLGELVASSSVIMSTGMGEVANEGSGGGTADFVDVQLECRMYVVCETIQPPPLQRLQQQRRRSIDTVGN